MDYVLIKSNVYSFYDAFTCTARNSHASNLNINRNYKQNAYPCQQQQQQQHTDVIVRLCDENFEMN